MTQKSTSSSTHQHPNQKAWVKSMDMLGTKFNLAFNTPSGKFQTNLGGYVTLFMGVFSLFCFFVVMSQYFNRSSPEVNTSTEFFTKHTEFDMNKHNLLNPFSIFFGPSLVLQGIDKYLTIKANVYDIDYSTPDEGFKPTLVHQIDFQLCSQVTEPTLRNYLEKYSILPGGGNVWNSTLCPALEQVPDAMKVSADGETFKFRVMSIHFYPCSLDDPTQCIPPPMFKFASLSYSLLDKFYEASDFKNPERSAQGRGDLRFDLGLTKYKQFGVKLNRVVDKTMQFRQPKIRTDYASLEKFATDFTGRDETQTHCTKAEIAKGALGTCKEYFVFDYFAKQDMLKIRRNYKEVTTMLGEFGGILKLISTSLFFLGALYYNRQMKRYLSRRIFTIEKEGLSFVKNVMSQNNFTASQPSSSKALPNAKVLKPEAEPLSNRNQSKQPGKFHQKHQGFNFHSQGIFGGNLPHSDRNTRKRLNEVMTESFKQRGSIENYISQLNIVEVMKEAFFDSYQLKLFPIALLLAKADEMEKSQAAKASKRVFAKSNQVLGASTKINIRDQHNNNQYAKEVEREGDQGEEGDQGFDAQEKPEHEKLSFDEAYRQLMAAEPESELKKMINHYLIRKLGPKSQMPVTPAQSLVSGSEARSLRIESALKEKLQNVIVIDEGAPEPKTILKRQSRDEPKDKKVDLTAGNMSPMLMRMGKRPSFRKSKNGSMKFMKKIGQARRGSKSSLKSARSGGVPDDLISQRSDAESNLALESSKQRNLGGSEFSSRVRSRFAALE